MRFNCSSFIILLFVVSVFKISAQNNSQRLESSHAKVYMNGRMLSNSEIRNVLKVNPEALASYEKGLKLRRAGTPMLIGGIIVSVVGMGVMASGMEVGQANGFNTSSNVKYNDNYFIGLGVSAIGEALLAGGIVCRLIGRSRIRNAANVYNSSLAFEQVPSYKLRLGIQPNGLGVLLSF